MGISASPSINSIARTFGYKTTAGNAGDTTPYSLSDYIRGGSYVSANDNGVSGIAASLSNLSLSQFVGTSKHIWAYGTAASQISANGDTWLNPSYAIGGPDSGYASCAVQPSSGETLQVTGFQTDSSNLIPSDATIENVEFHAYMALGGTAATRALQAQLYVNSSLIAVLDCSQTTTLIDYYTTVTLSYSQLTSSTILVDFNASTGDTGTCSARVSAAWIRTRWYRS